MCVLFVRGHNKELDCLADLLDPIVGIEHLKQVLKLSLLWKVVEEQKCLALPHILRVMSEGIIRDWLTGHSLRLAVDVIAELFKLHDINVSVKA